MVDIGAQGSIRLPVEEDQCAHMPFSCDDILFRACSTVAIVRISSFIDMYPSKNCLYRSRKITRLLLVEDVEKTTKARCLLPGHSCCLGNRFLDVAQLIVAQLILGQFKRVVSKRFIADCMIVEKIVESFIVEIVVHIQIV